MMEAKRFADTGYAEPATEVRVRGAAGLCRPVELQRSPSRFRSARSNPQEARLHSRSCAARVPAHTEDE